MRSLRIEVISSGRSFTGFLSSSDGWLEVGAAEFPAPLGDLDSGGELDRRVARGDPDPVESPLALRDLVLFAGAQQPRRLRQGRTNLCVRRAGLMEMPVDLRELLIARRGRASTCQVIAAALEIVHARVDRLDRLLVLGLDVEAHLR